MKHFMLRNLMLLSLLCSTWGVSSVWAQLTDGGVYYFESKYLTGKSITTADATKLTLVTTDPSDLNQLWVANEVSTGSGGFTLRNLGNGQYMKSTNSNSGSSYWHTVETADANCQFSCTGPDGNVTYAMRATNTDHAQHFMHAPDASKVVGWAETSEASRWYIRDVSGALSNLFSDAACTTLKKEFADEAALTADTDYLKLPETLRNMVKKVYNQAWAENNYDDVNKNPWGAEYAKKYRVQWYEPYTEPECAASALRINAHSNLNNPTGIFANSGDVLFVMVEGEIKEGAYLYLAKYTGHNKLGGYKDGVQLQSGLNVVPVTEDGSNYCINYVVKTFDTSKGTGKKAIIEGRELSNYPDLQIHIEGGYINGYWNKMGDNADHNGDFNYPADTDADWDYIKERATQTDVTVLGEYVTLQFPLTEEGTGDDKGMATYFNSYNGNTTSLEASIEEWDNVMIWERLLMGVLGEDVIEKEDKKSPYSDESKVTAYTGDDGDDFGCDYSEYYRIHGLSFGTEGGYMYGGWDHCGYNFNTMESIMLSIVDEAGPHWGPAHEIGHQHQGPLNMRGLTEVTNNLFSNVVLWYFGKSTSRYNGTEGSLSNVLQQFNAEGTDFFSNNIWAQTIMYYKLFLYYHVLGNNPKFYPRLFEMLRQNPMAIEYNQDGGKCLMHFYKLCCDAAGEDLTEFFRAHGFFNVMEDRFVGDYSNAIYNMTQAQIDAAIAEVKAKPYPENIAVLFITDATGEGNIKSNRGDDVYLKHFDTNNSGNLISGELGNYATFNTVAAPSYNYTISGNTVTMEGTGGVGFAILNEKGELIGFSDTKTFEISDETMEALSNGDAQIVVMPATGAPVEATASMSESEIKRTLLVELIAQAEALDALTDTDGKKIGFYKSSYMTDLHNALTKAQEVVENNTVSAYTPVFNALKAAIDDLKSKEFAKITMKPGTYTVRNLAYTTRYLSVNGSNEVVTSTPAELADTEKWVFEQGDGNNVYYIKNLSTKKYVNALAQSTVVSATTSEIADAKGWLVEDLGNGVFGITCQDENNQAMHSAANASYKIVGWNTGATASRWYLTALETEQLSAEQQALEELIALSEDMLERVANVETTTEGFSLTEDNYYCNAPMMANWYGDKFEGYHVLFDKDYSTYLHTDYTGADSKDGLDHYLRVDLGEGNSASLFTFNYATRNSSNQNPTAITVEGCNEENGTYELITKLTRDADKLISGANNEYYSAVMGLSSKSYRFLRFMVTGTIQGATAGPSDNTETPDVNEENKHVFFVFSEFGVSKATCNVTALPKYSTLTNDDVTAAFNAIREAKFAYANATQASDYTAAYNDLKGYYDNLVEAYNTGDQTALADKKKELLALINNTTALIGQCGEVIAQLETVRAITLNATNATTYPYLSCSNLYYENNPTNEDVDDNCEDLLDGNPATHIHTDYEATESTYPHYLQVDFGPTEAAPEFFKFTYTTRSNSANQVPKTIVVKGSNDGENFEAVLATFSSEDAVNALPTTQNTTWTSADAIVGGYRYLRFYVTKSPQGTAKPYFAMAEFGMSEVTPAHYDVTVNSGAGEVDEELLLATYKENQEANSTHTYATTEAQLDKAIADLQAQYDALEAAKSVVDKEQLIQLIATATEKLAACGTVTPNDEELDVEFKEETAGSVNKNMLRELYRAIKTAEGVRDNANATQEEVNAASETLTSLIGTVGTAQQSENKANLKQEIADMEELLTECATNPGSASKQLIADCQTALQTAKNVYDADNTTVDEYADAKTVLHENFYTKLFNAKNSTAKAALYTAITDMESLLDDCEDNSDSEIQELIADCQTELQTAKNVYNADNTTVDGYSQATTNLTTLYTELSVAKAKAELRTEISELEDLIVKCRIAGTTIVTTVEDCDLQATSPDAAFYISTNAQTNESGIANLVDDDKNSFFQTKSGVGEAHYLLVYAGADKTFKKFKFSYQTCNNPLPYAIEVYGSNDNAYFTKLATFTKDDAQNPLPSSTNRDWTSSEIGNGTAYRYLRFNVTKSGVVLKIDDDKEIITDEGQQLSNKYKNALSATDAATSQSEYCFAMSNFDLTNIVDEEQPTEILAGTVTEELLTNATNANTAAKALAEESVDKDALNLKTSQLQEIYETLYAAYGIQVSLATTVESRDKLLSNIEYGKTIGTFSAPYATVIPEGVTAYYAKQEYNGGTVSLTPIEDATALPANQGVILIGEAGVNSVTFYPATDETPADLSANKFSNSATGSVDMEGNDYILANGGQGIGFYQATPETTLKQGKAFFRLPADAAPSSLVLKFGGNTTDIDAVTTGTPSDNELIYDIYGRRVTEVKKGNIYIKNGKKFFVK